MILDESCLDRTLNPKVIGSNPIRPTIIYSQFKAIISTWQHLAFGDSLNPLGRY